MKISKPYIVTVDKDGKIPVESFKDMIDIKRVEYYELEVADKKTGALRLSFFDKNKKLIKARKNK